MLTIFAQGGNVKLGVDATYFPNHEGTFFGPSLSVETAISEKFSLSLQGSYGTYVNARSGGSKLVSNGITFNPEFRFFPNGKPLRVFF